MSTPKAETANRLSAVFYTVTALVSLAGATTAATAWLGWPVLPAATAVGVVELGGIALAARADLRRRLGERAVSARFLSAAVAVFAVGFQWWGHSDHRQGAFFAGTSGLAYATWLINSADRRRDALRAAGQLPPPAPVYGLVQWAREPVMTWQARRLALQDPTLGLYGSLSAAREQARTRARQRALADLLRRKLAQGKDKLSAEIAATTYDLDRIAGQLAASADYDGLAALIAADLRPATVAAPDTAAAAVEAATPEPSKVAARPAVPAAKRPGGQTSRRRAVKAPAGRGAKLAAMREFWLSERAEGRDPSLAAMDRAAGTNGLAKRYRPEWLAEEDKAATFARDLAQLSPDRVTDG